MKWRETFDMEMSDDGAWEDHWRIVDKTEHESGSGPEAANGRWAEHVRSARVFQTSTCSAIARASSTSMPRYLVDLGMPEQELDGPEIAGAPMSEPLVLDTRHSHLGRVEMWRVALGRTYLLPPLSSGGALVVQP